MSAKGREQHGGLRMDRLRRQPIRTRASEKLKRHSPFPARLRYVLPQLHSENVDPQEQVLLQPAPTPTKTQSDSRPRTLLLQHPTSARVLFPRRVNGLDRQFDVGPPLH